ncbi:uncharacterized protein LOC132722355 [Ruditapes philippinarum]|uniref:uncharacterized protein LOC132722355 n=1 Tax=Ruditapes philippinarum TaxID=129788 RepID=UPI00295C2367|nr:uncharacterized protein LOC132722355 [Ruditapes philippinarum]
MEKTMIHYGVVLIFIAGCFCLPSKRMFLDVNCDKVFDCDSKNNETDSADKLICATDGHTYDSKCHLDQENQHRYCILGDFNPVAVVHKGNCTDLEESDMLW